MFFIKNQLFKLHEKSFYLCVCWLPFSMFICPHFLNNNNNNYIPVYMYIYIILFDWLINFTEFVHQSNYNNLDAMSSNKMLIVKREQRT